MKTFKTPMRMCVGCRVSYPKNQLIRVVRSPEGVVSLDTRGKAAGRGAYLCKNEDCLKKAVKSKIISRTLEVTVDDNLLEQLKEQLSQDGN